MFGSLFELLFSQWSDCDAMLLVSIDVVDIPNIKLLKKKSIHRASYFVKMMI